MAHNKGCPKAFGKAMQAARWKGEVEIPYRLLAELLGWIPETEDAPPCKGIEGGSRAQLERYENRDMLPDWNVAKHIIFHLQSSPTHFECMIFGYARDVYRKVGVNVREQTVTDFAHDLMEDYAEFVEKKLWRVH